MFDLTHWRLSKDSSLHQCYLGLTPVCPDKCRLGGGNNIATLQWLIIDFVAFDIMLIAMLSFVACCVQRAGGGLSEL